LNTNNSNPLKKCARARSLSKGDWIWIGSIELLRIDSETKTFKIPVKRKAGDVVKQMNDYNIRYGITKRNPFVLREFFEDFLSRSSYRIVIIHNKQGGLDTFKKLNSKMIACPVSQQSNGFAYNIPCGIKHDRIVFTVFKDFSGTVVIEVFRR
jgi:hypothetical protein